MSIRYFDLIKPLQHPIPHPASLVGRRRWVCHVDHEKNHFLFCFFFPFYTIFFFISTQEMKVFRLFFTRIPTFVLSEEIKQKNRRSLYPRTNLFNAMKRGNARKKNQFELFLFYALTSMFDSNTFYAGYFDESWKIINILSLNIAILTNMLLKSGRRLSGLQIIQRRLDEMVNITSIMFNYAGIRPCTINIFAHITRAEAGHLILFYSQIYSSVECSFPMVSNVVFTCELIVSKFTEILL